MAPHSSGASLPSTEAEATRSRYFAWRASHPSEAGLLADVPQDVVSALWAAAWRAGAWDAIRRNASLGLNLVQLIQRLEEVYRLYADDQVDRVFNEELEAASAYWRGDAST